MFLPFVQRFYWTGTSAILAPRNPRTKEKLGLAYRAFHHPMQCARPAVSPSDRWNAPCVPAAKAKLR